MSQFENYNPPTVVVAIIPVINQGVLLIERGNPNESGYGKLALPGGFQEMGETWQETAIREVKEEIGLDVENPVLYKVCTVNNKNLLFCVVNDVEDLTDAKPTAEATQIVVADWSLEKEEMAYTTHYNAFMGYTSERVARLLRGMA